ncbi:MAG TPA: SGNH/GDSL hydrolase family protein [Anaerolineales bacterium]|nr:SGNH/GDSL hydrolase family protein [Anaerolineales bacterium]
MNERVRPVYVLFKGIGLFVLINVLYAMIQPPVARFSAYNLLFPGRERLPFGEAHNSFVVSIDDVDAMFATHAISSRKKPGEIRVAVIGDSSVWGENLHLEETLTGQWNQPGLQCGGSRIQVYNLGYPHPSVVKDMIFLEKLTEYEPDIIVWMITLNTLSSRRVNPFLIENRDAALRLLEAYNLPFYGLEELAREQDSFVDKTIVGRRSFLARYIKLQSLGFLWSATGKDFNLFNESVTISNDVSNDLIYRELLPGDDLETMMLEDALAVGHDIAGSIPVLLVNEPIFMAAGLNSDLRYNDFYPRWAYDHYRDAIATEVEQHGWNYLDLWDAVPQKYFTDTPLHLNADGERLFAEHLNSAVRSMVCK